MTILLRKIAGEARALIRTDRRVLLGPGRAPSLLQTVGAFAMAVGPVLLFLLLNAIALHYLGSDGGVLLAAAPIVELRAKHAKLVKEANDALKASQAKAKAENRALTKEELEADDAYQAKIEAVLQEIRVEERKLERERQLGSAAAKRNEEDPDVPGSGRQARVTDARLRAEDDPARGFRSGQDFCLAVMRNADARERSEVEDERLQTLAVQDDGKAVKAGAGVAFLMPTAFAPARAAVGSDEAGNYSDRYGGFLTPTTRLPQLLQIEPESDPTEGLTQSLPMATPQVEIAARVDKDHTSSVSGGLTFSRRPETGTTTGQRIEFEMITLKAASLWGIGYATMEILRDSPISFAALISAGFRQQRAFHILKEKIRGGGGNEYVGMMNSPAKVAVAKETNQPADTIVGRNITKMAERCWNFGAAIWLANNDTRSQLAEAHIPIGTGDAIRIYMPAQQPGFPDMLWGRPVYYTEQCATVGDEGDLMLIVPSQFLEGVYMPMEEASSVHVRFVNGEQTFRFWERNCGAPWWRAALTPARSTKTLSPIVTLAARA